MKISRLSCLLTALALLCGPPAISSAYGANTYWNPGVLRQSWSSDLLPLVSNQLNVMTDARLATKARGDGVTDDTGAIRAAIGILSQSGGGVVYFPPGIYNLNVPSGQPNGSPLVVPSNIILRGAGPTASTLVIFNPNASLETDYIGYWGGINFTSCSYCGMTDIGVTEDNPSNLPVAAVWNRGAQNVKDVFLNDVTFNLTNTKSIWFEAITNFVLINSLVNHSVNPAANQGGPLYFVFDTNISLLNNTINYEYGRIHLLFDTNLLVENNTMIRNAMGLDTASGAIESGGMELTFSKTVQILNNSLTTLNAPADEVGDGEAIMSQNSNIADVLDLGTITASTTTTISDTGSLWGPVTAARILQYPVVAVIVSGSGVGQWRNVTALDIGTKTLTVGQPWTTVPEAGSLFSLLSWTLQNARIGGNTITNFPNGIVIYNGCQACNVSNNKLVDSRQIVLRVADTDPDLSAYPESRRIHDVMLNSAVTGNTVSNTAGIRPAYIVLDVEAFSATNYRGMGMMNIRFEDNTVNPYPPNPSLSYDLGLTEIPQEGIFPCFLFGPTPARDPLTTVFRNIRYQGNSLTAPVTYGAYFASYATSLACVTPSND